MGTIKSRNYKVCYHLYLLPEAILSNRMHYYPKPTEIAPYYPFLVKLIRQLALGTDTTKQLIMQLQQVRAQGGPLFSLERLQVSNSKYVQDAEWVIMYEGMEADKDVKLFVGGAPKCMPICESEKKYELLNKILGKLLDEHQQSERAYFPNDLFVNELYFTDDVDLVVGENRELFIHVDESLTDFLLALNSRSE